MGQLLVLLNPITNIFILIVLIIKFHAIQDFLVNAKAK